MTTDSILTTHAAKDFFTSRYANVIFIPSEKIAICIVKADYIPMADFKSLFNEISKLIKQGNNSKFIFDKRKLITFHQPSMEWYHLIWKEEMYQVGLKKHRKLLPDDKLFEQSVITGRKKIIRENPSFDYTKYDIIYCSTMEQAIEN